jgi:multidrug efflux pump subunit AcrA (membrane-fusion protein)
MYQAVVAVVDERVREIRVTREDFDRLAKALSTLAQAQERTEARMGELARAQARTEARVSELAEAQARTEERVGRLEQAMERLAEAQARTEDALQELSRQVGALSENVGYGLEDIARVVLPGYLQFRYGLKVSRLERRLFQVDGEAVEFDLYGEGSRDGKPIAVLGEVKSRIYWREVVQFRERLERVRPQMIREAVPLMFGYFIDLTAMEAAQEDILLIASYQPAVDMQAAAMER